MEFIVIIFPFIIIISWFWLIDLDKNRITKYLTSRGDSVTDITWEIFGKGWISERGKEGGGNRIYRLTYSDSYGNLKQAWCKTAMLSGVYITDEDIVKPATVNGRALSDAEKVVLLEDELRKLKAEKMANK